MPKLARINQTTGEVTNLIAPYGPPQGYIEVEISDDSPVSIGWTYSNGEFSAPTVPEIEEENEI
jgi:hypothetical protein